MKFIADSLSMVVVLIFVTVGFIPQAGATDLWKTLPVPISAPKAKATGYANVNGAEIYFTIHGSGEPLILLHGGLGNTECWGGQISAFSAKYKVINIASRGHGRSTRDNQAYSYHLMASDVLAVMDILSLKKASIVGWSDGGIIGLDIAINNPDRLIKLFAFGANFNPSGVKSSVETDTTFGAYVERAAVDYARLSKTPKQFDEFVAQISEMWAKLPNFSPEQLKSIRVPVAIVDGEYDEAIDYEHTKQMAALIPGSTLIILSNLSHFAMWQDTETFNTTVLKYLGMK
ncbi:predicted alpha/beta hydrolase [Desulforapulum autotrophicum HRM2]|uniref:Predicted alpha/beta hydrolase n=1 Tax=Desulforapulum autotrophicum (strain ATCC 43914 / DSM 3382 / VKM B-1955 / HRM2) TaxID=177437 RepID=C0QLJ6_DESAH|nr:alpha/beta hydrolase [Desulforapulum autotrophicum]ACN16300.1 predicted alpha/beta hydrolase [Desulforapulum autotrophicum HRM2]